MSPSARCPDRSGRRGASLVAVLAILSICLALAYSVSRSQISLIMMQRNSGRRAEARQAALSGVAAGLRMMSHKDWAGVAGSNSAWISDTQRYVVRFEAGDNQLSPEDEAYGEFPLRVTIVSTGYAEEDRDPALLASYQIRAVVRLVPQAMPAEPAGWAEVQQYSLYQWQPNSQAEFKVQVPCRIDGPVRIQKELDLCEVYPQDNSAKDQLLSGLNQMRSSGRPDYRPFNGPVHLDFDETPSETRSLLTDELGVSIQDVEQSNIADWQVPSSIPTYQLYPGGPDYEAETLPSSLADTTIEADPQTNPLGLFYRTGRVTIYDNVTIHGTILANGNSGDVEIDGSNVRIEPVRLPPLDGEIQPVRLPAILADGDVEISGQATGSIEGLVSAGKEFEAEQGPQAAIAFTIEGKVVSQDVLIRGRNEWEHNAGWWALRNTEFAGQQAVGEPFFPVWLEAEYNLVSAPGFRLQPPSAPSRHHWHDDLSNPLFIPSDPDAGLRWELVDWREGD